MQQGLCCEALWPKMEIADVIFVLSWRGVSMPIYIYACFAAFGRKSHVYRCVPSGLWENQTCASIRWSKRHACNSFVVVCGVFTKILFPLINRCFVLVIGSVVLSSFDSVGLACHMDSKFCHHVMKYKRKHVPLKAVCDGWNDRICSHGKIVMDLCLVAQAMESFEPRGTWGVWGPLTCKK